MAQQDNTAAGSGTEKIEGTVEAWESGSLGNSAEHAKPVDAQTEAAINASLGLKPNQFTTHLTTELATKAFEAWENELRKDPAGFMTPEEAARLEVAPLSEQRAIYFMALLREVA